MQVYILRCFSEHATSVDAGPMFGQLSNLTPPPPAPHVSISVRDLVTTRMQHVKMQWGQLWLSGLISNLGGVLPLPLSVGIAQLLSAEYPTGLPARYLRYEPSWRM